MIFEQAYSRLSFSSYAKDCLTTSQVPSVATFSQLWTGTSFLQWHLASQTAIVSRPHFLGPPLSVFCSVLFLSHPISQPTSPPESEPLGRTKSKGVTQSDPERKLGCSSVSSMTSKKIQRYQQLLPQPAWRRKGKPALHRCSWQMCGHVADVWSCVVMKRGLEAEVLPICSEAQ